MAGTEISVREKQSAAQQPVFISNKLALWFAIACGLSVANVYYAQPLLDVIAGEFGIARSSVGIVITVTQACYALGLLLLVPLGDLVNRRWLIPGQMLLSVLALTIIAFAPGTGILFAGMAVAGLLAVVTQTLVAYAATMAAPSERGRIVGRVTSGVVIGILLARSAAGVLTDLAGWRSVYLFSALCLLVVALILLRLLPNEQPKGSLTYFQLLRSVILLFKEERVLRIRSLLCLFIFSAFSILWTSLVLPLSLPPLSLSHSAIGAFGLAGAAGALGATRAGRLADRGRGQLTTGVALALLLMSWLPISYTGHSLTALVVGILLLDLAVQAVHVTNQSMIFNVRPEARSRLTAAYMIFYSIGSAIGSISATSIYAYAGWSGVCWLGAGVSMIALLFWAITRRLT
ncbi:MFS transporter [Paenibacillus tepidiphilus]|uniref:MFS transporter n=1 Tax=Paenibacillus tepidiphilus TaxID=2608683 RepID=UPI00123A2C49|nr:MFS transporter [Paenibacillus tepidiphilus]